MKLRNLCLNKVFAFLLAAAACLACSQPACSQTEQTAKPAALGKDAPFSVKNAYFQKYGKAWAAATDEERADFLSKYEEYSAEELEAIMAARSAIPKDKKTTFAMKNAFFNEFVIPWESGTKEQKTQFMNELSNQRKDKQEREKMYRQWQVNQQDAKTRAKQQEEQNKQQRLQKQAEVRKEEQTIRNQQNESKQRLQQKSRGLGN